MKQVFIFLGLAILFIAGVGIFFQKANKNQLNINLNQKQNQESKEITVGNTRLTVEIADTNEKRLKGLGQRGSLQENSGMLFVFDQKNTIRSFWMKDMGFPLDFVWIKNGKVSQIDKNVPFPPPGTDDSKLTIYTSNLPVDYVLEVNAGFCDKNEIKVDDIVDLSKI